MRTYHSKYHSRKIKTMDGTFDSKKEMRRYQELQWMEKAGQISGLRRQVKYVLIPAQREPDKTGPRGGRVRGRVIEKEVAYYADFVYTSSGKTIVEDVKGVHTKDYIIKRKLMLWVHGIRILET